MKKKDLAVYLSGEIHSDWRTDIIDDCNKILAFEFLSLITLHEARLIMLL